MNTKLKKILIILIILLIIALIGFLVYKFLIKKPAEEYVPGKFPPGKEGEFVPPEEEFIPEAELKIKAISKEAVMSPTLTADKNQVIYYLRSNGNIWQSDFDGTNLTQFSNVVLDNLVDVFWSPDKAKSISVFQDKTGSISKYLYDYSAGNVFPLNKYIKDIYWSSDSKKIAYQYYNEFTDDNNINTANPDGSSPSTVLRTRMRDLIVEWPKGSEIFLREKPSGLVTNSLYSLNAFSKIFIKTISDTYGLSIKWSPDGSQLLYSKTNSKGKNIAIFTADRSGSNQKPITINTLAEKCVWSQDPRIIFCAIPKNIEEAGILPDDFYKGTFLADDEFWKIDLETEEKTKILEQDEMPETYDAADLFLSPEESYLFFVNKVNGLLYSIKME